MEHLWGILRNKLIHLLDQFVPFKLVGTNYKQPWLNRTIKQLSRRKQRCYNRAKSTKSSLHWQYYKTVKKDMQRECRKAYNYYMNKTIFNPFENGRKKNLFRYVKSLRRDNTGIPTLYNNGTAYSTNEAKANALNQYFATVFVQDDNTTLPDKGQSPYPDLPLFTTNVDDVTILLKQVDPYKATGPDGIPPRLLKEIANELSPSLTLVFNASLQQGKLPDDWKKAVVTPLFKKGNHNDPANYRPISLTSVCCKLLERIIHSNIMSHLNNCNILSDVQFGFRRRRSAELQLLRTVNDFVLNLNNNKQTDIILLDLSKAFDKVSHRCLKLKLEYYGIRHKTLQWISSFLDQRTQRVVCSGHTSLPIDVTSGVPQGTVLGPLLFLIYINDLPDLITSSCSLFADDCLLYREIDTPNDSQTLQSDLYKLETWANEWLMSFNINKCEVIQITLKNPIQSAYYLYGHQLKQVTEAKYLGVTLDSKLNFNKHIDAVCKKVNTMLSFIRRNLHTQLTHVKSQAYRMYIRPILEYSSTVWAPHTKRSIDKLEAVQKRAARYVMNDYSYNSSVSSMIRSLKWNSLSTRRNISRLIFYKILHQTGS